MLPDQDSGGAGAWVELKLFLGWARNRVPRSPPISVTWFMTRASSNLLSAYVADCASNLRSHYCYQVLLETSGGAKVVSGGNDYLRPRREHLFRGRRVKVRDLVDAGLLEPGTTLVSDRPHEGVPLQITVTRTGQLRLSDGRESKTPSGAYRDLTGKAADGWYTWRVADAGQLLHDLRRQLLDQLAPEDPEDAAADFELREDEFLASALKAAESGSPRQVTVRELVGVWGARVRDFGVNERVDADLNNRGLTTVPDFRAVTLDDTVSIVRTIQTAENAVPAPSGVQVPAILIGAPQVAVTVDEEGTPWDHGLTIGNLASASKGVTSVAPDAEISKAITLMLLDDYSQLAVMAGARSLRGAVSLKSIAKARNANPRASLSAALIKADPVPYTADLISTLPLIQRNEFVFVVGSDQSVTGIVTLADVVEAYGNMASPFFMIGRIDQRLRGIVEAIFPMETISVLCDPDSRRSLSGCEQLTMGDYQRILENPECWDKLNWQLDRKAVCARLDEIAKIRNNLMHFNNDPLPEDVISMLQNFLGLLQDYGD